MGTYNPQKIEEKWQKYWEKHPELSIADDESKKAKFYCLDMFPYPSGDGLHVGHVESYTATDIISRYLRMNGKNVLHPTGWDAFGLPAENYAIKTKIHPKVTTQKAIATFKSQMIKLGLSYDWSREVDSSSPDYYRWTQWFFLLLYKNGLAYRKKASVNWCLKCQTVLANEQVINGKCERCETEVIQKDLEQWFFKITDFIEDSFLEARLLSTEMAQRSRASITSGLLKGLDKVDWPESTKAAQRNWIGKSEGAVIKFLIKTSPASGHPSLIKEGKGEVLEVFTTRLDTIYGCTYCVIAPEHPLITNYKLQIENYDEVEAYLIEAQNKTELDRMESKDKTGVEIQGIKVVNPFTNEEVPIFVADYVLGHYGTGAVMAVPAHDERDFEFAKKYNLPVRQSIAPLLVVKEGNDAVKDNKPTVRRKTVVAILKHWAKDEIFCLHWEKFGWRSFIIGGIKENESAEQAAIREAKEESGYQNIKSVRKIGGDVHSNFYAAHKNENRYAETECYYIELGGDEYKEPEEKDIKNHKGEWVSRDRVCNYVNLNIHEWYCNVFNKGELAFVDDGVLVNSEKYSDMTSEKSREEMVKWLEKNNLGGRKINYKLRDWLVSRQRYWGTPIPIIYCETCSKKKEQVLMLHGWEDSSKTGFFPALKKNLEDKGYEIFAFDQPNTNTPDYDKWYKFIEEKIKENKLENFHLIGHSMGGHLAVKLAEKYKLKRLLLIAPVGFRPSEEYFNQFTDKLEKDEMEIFKKFQNRSFDIKRVKNNVQKIGIVFGAKDPWITKEIRDNYINKFKDVAKIDILESEAHMAEGGGVKRVEFLENLFTQSNPGIVPVPEKDLPVLLPDDVDFLPTGESPLAGSKKFHDVKCPECGAKVRRESDTMDTFVCSSWYYFRYTDPKNEKEFASKELIKKWLPVDLYVGGAEHTVMHLLYSRFFTKVLHRLGYIDFDEPFLKLRHQGILLGEDNYKMSKSRGNVINPDDVASQYGADSLRMFEMFMGPLEDVKPWNTKGIIGIKRFLDKVYKLANKITHESETNEKKVRANKKLNNLLHRTIKKVTGDIENLKFNTAISSLMILTNELEKEEKLLVTDYKLLITLLSPFAPHISEELWSQLGHKDSIFKEKWPKYDPKLIKDEEIELVVQVNGKVRDRIKASADISEEEAKNLALESEKVKKYTYGKEIKKAIFVKGKLINIVV